MSGAEFLNIASLISLGALAVSLLMVAVRIVKGPTLADRVLALDSLVSIAIGFIAVIAIMTEYALYLDVAIALGLVGFLSTVAFARFIISKANNEDEGSQTDTPEMSEPTP